MLVSEEDFGNSRVNMRARAWGAVLSWLWYQMEVICGFNDLIILYRIITHQKFLKDGQEFKSVDV